VAAELGLRAAPLVRVTAGARPPADSEIPLLPFRGWIGPVTTWSRALAPVDVMLLHAKTRASNVFHPEPIQLPSIARLPTVDASAADLVVVDRDQSAALAQENGVADFVRRGGSLLVYAADQSAVDVVNGLFGWRLATQPSVAGPLGEASYKSTDPLIASRFPDAPAVYSREAETTTGVPNISFQHASLPAAASSIYAFSLVHAFSMPLSNDGRLMYVGYTAIAKQENDEGYDEDERKAWMEVMKCMIAGQSQFDV